MSLPATGAYLKRLREDAGMSRLALSKKVETSDSQIIRIESGQETRGSLLAKIIKVLKANADDVIDLLTSPDYTAEHGTARAEAWIKKRQQVHGTMVVHPDVESLLQRLTEYELGRWVEVGERIIKERSK